MLKIKNKILLCILFIFIIFQMITMAAAILMGSTAEDRGDLVSGEVTIVNKALAADAAGTITSVEIWAKAEMAGAEVAIFSADGNDLTSGDSEIINNGNGAGVVLAGSKQTFVVDLDVEIGDYIGIYFLSGQIEVDATGGDGAWYGGDDYIPCTGQTLTLESGWGISIYATGTTPAVGTHVFFTLGSDF